MRIRVVESCKKATINAYNARLAVNVALTKLKVSRLIRLPCFTSIAVHGNIAVMQFRTPFLFLSDSVVENAHDDSVTKRQVSLGEES
jgi:hypothetical protein